MSYPVRFSVQQQAVGAATGIGGPEASQGHSHEIQQSRQAARCPAQLAAT